jgi:hypothetical protein
VSRRQYVVAVLCIAVVALGVAWVAGRQSERAGHAPPPSLDAERLGPDPGEPVAGYLAGLPARLPPPGAAAVPALLQLDPELGSDALAARLAGAGAGVAEVRRVVFRVPLPRVQTALRFQPLPTVDLADPAAALSRALELAQQGAQRQAAAEVPALSGRAAGVARYESAALSGSGPVVLAVLVHADRAQLLRLAGLPGVRAVDAAPEGTPDSGTALAPLLPGQRDTAGPVPDDGPVPPPPATG